MGFKGYALIQSNDLILSIPQVITGTKTIPAFNHPFLATSLIDFWGNRWNMVMRNIFHKQIFSKRPTSSAWERNLKGLQVFHMSGLMHEIIMTIVHREINLEQWLFFMIQGIAIYLQLNCIPRTFRERIPKPLSTILTILFLGCTGKLFLASFIRTEEYKQFLAKYSVI
ncbi:uncharacterized protein BX663DRAFT_432409 [Cokeromyces recurvatus]|uniref:uncharacterized protein n=1 Tax=Cokeromyces recurvatus TaxID=90255 RepID=UPI00221FDFF5|nr:uncharacterized protein BX663DRAFT_432409 [Cokeromyces recurvatus]KAI7904044.1 hypothetical protein BX663DRAFT_432409 [Cokeromyces recurvatus]